METSLRFKSIFKFKVSFTFLIYLVYFSGASLYAATWQDDFNAAVMNEAWRGDLNYFGLQDGQLRGVSFHPVLPPVLRFIEVGQEWADYVASCKINVVQPNLAICTKGALILRHKDGEGYVFALHIATQRVEVYRLSGEMLLSVPMPLQLKTWYHVHAELQGDEFRFYVDNKQVGHLRDNRSPAGSVGLAVEDTMGVLFDDFVVTGPAIPAGGHGTTAVDPKGKLATRWAILKS